ncbi:MAG TPA: RTX toxin [Thermoanaerobaculia bacterium]|nr:RTX toxin [Thermoanaerobaculia bacterium]
MKTASAVRPFSVAERRPESLWSKAGLFGLAVALWAFPVVAAAPPAPGTWVPQGPGPTIFGQTEGIENDEVVGAIHTVAPHPHAAGTIFVGAVNGGVWKTTNATSQNVKWTRLTDNQASNSIGALEFDPTDPAYNTLVAGIGRFSSFSNTGGARVGLLKTTNDGNTWTLIDGGGVLFNKNVSGVAPRGNTIVVAVNTATPNTTANIGIWRTTNGGATFTQISNGNGTATGLPVGITNDLVGDPNNPSRLFTSVTFAELGGGRNGFYRSDDTGATWTRVSNAAIEALMISGTTGNVEFAVGKHNNVYAAIVNGGRLAAVFRSGDGGTTWTSMGVPLTNDGAPTGAHPGAQGNFHLSIAADPTDANIVYVGGDRQPLLNELSGGPFSFPNSIGAENFTGRSFRGDASKPAGSQWVHLTHSSTLGAAGGGTASNSAPHADSREMAFDARGDLIETDDGGIYRRTSPRSNTGDWFSLNGDIQTTEIHDVSYDTLANVAFGGTQDTGLPYQLVSSQVTWDTLLQGDGGDVAVDDFTIPGTSVRYSSNQNLGNFNRTFWDSGNNFLGFAFPALTLVGGGARPVRQFYTPIAVNGVDGTRLVISAANSVYESLDRGDTIVEAGPGILPTGTGADPLAYGAGGNPNALYVGAANRVFIRTAAYPAPLVASATFPGNATALVVTDIVLDPSDANTAYVTNQAGVFRTTNAGASWTTLTGNLLSLNPSTVRSIALVTTPAGDAVIVGTQNGVFYANEASGFTTWSRLGNGFPVVPVYDLDYDAADNVLIAGTMGRGAWKLPSASSIVTGGL